MNVNILPNDRELGIACAAHAADILKDVIAKNGNARLVLSTGASQFEMFKALVKSDVDWSKVEMFHLDEYLGMSVEHPASFRKYLKERFADLINLKAAYYVNGEGDVGLHIAELTAEINKSPIDLALIGIGENGHIAFNDPPADFDTKESFIVVNLDEACRKQQLGEGWFPTFDDVPKQAITMTVYKIMQSKVILSCVPHSVKAEAVKNTLSLDVTNAVPATILKTHSDWTLYLDENSAALSREYI